MRTPAKLATMIAIACASVGACSTYTASPPLYAYFKWRSLCAKNSGSHAHSSPIEVDGFYESGGQGCGVYCRIGLMNGYSYVEADASSASRFGLVDSPGLYRFSMKQGDHPSCAAYYRYSGIVDVTHAPRHEACISSDRIEDRLSRYQVVNQTDSEVLGGARLVTSYKAVEEISTGRKLIEVHGYSIRWVGFLLLPFDGHKQCPETIVKHRLELTQILPPKRS